MTITSANLTVNPKPYMSLEPKPYVNPESLKP